MTVKIHELASKEFDEAIEWYNLQFKGLGTRFKNVVIEQINKIRKHPTWFLPEADNVYKAYIPKFPYKILFSIESNERVVVWAISHLHRKPWYWKNRIN